MGHGKWRLLPDWPPPSSPQRWHLIPGRGLALVPPAVTSQPARYRYDPSDPTPSVGGVLFRGDAGSRDDRKLERRADVLTFTSEPLESDLEAIGAVSAEIFARASRPHFDLFVRVCDVDWRGRSRNVCDGPVRISPERFTPDGDGVYRVPVELWPTAYRFRKNHRVRVHVSSGAHPRIARNLGSGEALGTGTTLTPVDVEILHDPAHPSAVVLPVVPTGAAIAQGR
jgi:putative CocE/NonD family hydrolase